MGQILVFKLDPSIRLSTIFVILHLKCIITRLFLNQTGISLYGKLLVKRPKVYFTDVGLLCYLTGLREPEHAASGLSALLLVTG